MKNLSGIFPAYRHTIMEMSSTLSNVLDFRYAKPGKFLSIDMSGQRSEKYLPANVSDFIDWMLAISTKWEITRLGNYPHDLCAPERITEIYQSELTIDNYFKVGFDASLAALLAAPRVIFQMGTEVEVVEHEDGSTTRNLCIKVIDENFIDRFTMRTAVEFKDISTYVRTNDLMVETGAVSAKMMIDPFQVASLRYSHRTCDAPITHTLTAVVVCGPLRSNLMPMTDAVHALSQQLMCNFVEYGFSYVDQLLAYELASHAVTEHLIDADASITENKFTIQVDASFVYHDYNSPFASPRFTATLNPELIASS